MTKNKIVYIGCPYSDENPLVREERFNIVSKITALLTKRGFVVFSPITYGHCLTKFCDLPTDFNFWQKFCLSFLEKSDLLLELRLEGYELSRGLIAEVKYAIDNSIEYKYFNHTYSMIDIETEAELIAELMK